MEVSDVNGCKKQAKHEWTNLGLLQKNVDQMFRPPMLLLLLNKKESLSSRSPVGNYSLNKKLTSVPGSFGRITGMVWGVL